MLWFLCVTASGAENTDQSGSVEEDNEVEPVPAATQLPEPATPDLEFIEFLGQFETDAGEWIDPGSLLMNEFDNFFDVVANQQNPDSN